MDRLRIIAVVCLCLLTQLTHGQPMAVQAVAADTPDLIIFIGNKDKNKEVKVCDNLANDWDLELSGNTIKGESGCWTVAAGTLKELTRKKSIPAKLTNGVAAKEVSIVLGGPSSADQAANGRAQGVKIITIDACLNNSNGVKAKGGTGCSKNKMTVRQNEMVAMRIENINPLKYEYELNGSGIELHTDGITAFEEALAKKRESDAQGFIQSNPVDQATQLNQKLSAQLLELSALNCLDKDKVSAVRNKATDEFAKLPSIASFNGTDPAPSDQLKEEYATDYNSIKEKLETLFGLEFEVSTLPYQPKARNIDFVKYELNVKNKKTNKSLTHEYNVFVRGGFKIDFSTGLVVTGLRDRQYDLRDVEVWMPDTVMTDTDTTYTSKQTRKGIIARGGLPVDFVLATMMNMTTRMSETVNIGASFGVGASLNGNFQAMVGGTVIFGKFQRFALHAGLALGWSSQLQNGYRCYNEHDKTGTTYDFGDINTAPVADMFDYSWFAGLTYNFTKVKSSTPEVD